MKKIISLALALVMVLSMASVAFASEVETAPELPTAVASEIKADGYTFAMNFKAVEPTAEQLAYYGDWDADFILTVNKAVTFNANGEADGYLGGQYDEWSPNWINVPFEDVTLAAGQSLKIMQYATSNVEGYTGTTYKDIVNTVKDFDCGVYFTPDFLTENQDLVVTLQLVISKGEESHAIGNTYTFKATAPALPTATVSEITAEGYTYAMNFKADAVTAEQLAYYGNWAADFVLTVNKAVTFNANDTADGYLGGQYEEWSPNWVNLPVEDVTVAAGGSIRIMQYVAGQVENYTGTTYSDIVNTVQDFDCGVYFSDAYLKANPDLKVTLELRMYNPDDSTKSYIVGDAYTFTVAALKNEKTGEEYADVNEALADAKADETVQVLKPATTAAVSVPAAATLDLNGNALTSTTLAAFGHIVDNSEDNSGLLKVEKDSLMLRADNKQLPVWTGEGYKFIEVFNFNKAALDGGKKYAFQPLFEEDAIELLLKGATLTGITMKVEVSWTQATGTRTQIFTYDDALVAQYLNSYDASTGKYGKMFTLTLNVEDIAEYENLTFKAVVSAPTMGGAVVKNAEPIVAASVA